MALPGPASCMLYASAIAGAVALRLAVKRYKLFPVVLAVCLGMQAGVVILVPTGIFIYRWRMRGKPEDQPGLRGPELLAWLPSWTSVAGACCGLVGVLLAQGFLVELSIWRGAALLECFAFVLIAGRVVATRDVAGVSARKLALDALRLLFRLTASLMIGNKLPRRSADAVVQAADAASLAAALVALGSLVTWRRSCYHGAADTFGAPSWCLVAASCALGCIARADLSKTFVPDALWTTALCLDAVSPLPQLGMIARSGGAADAMVGHHMAMLWSSRALALTFWWLIRGTWSRGTSWTGWSIMAVLAAQLVMLSRFMAYWCKGCWANGLFSPFACAEIAPAACKED